MINFEKMPGHIWLNGEFIQWENAKIHSMHHALHYGSGVFEGIRVYDGRVFKLKEHVKRLFESAEMLKMDIRYSENEVENVIYDVIKKQINLNGYVRPFVWRGADQMSIGVSNRNCNFAVAAWNISDKFLEKQRTRQAGLSLEVAKFRNQTISEAPIHAKASGLYVSNTISYYEAQEKGLDDALMLDSNGFISESTSANIFFVFNDHLVKTPTINACLKGITRQIVIDLFTEMNVELQEENLTISDISHAKEAFLTGTAIEITPVKKIIHHDRVLEFEIGSNVKKIINKYSLMTSGVGE